MEKNGRIGGVYPGIGKFEILWLPYPLRNLFPHLNENGFFEFFELFALEFGKHPISGFEPPVSADADLEPREFFGSKPRGNRFESVLPARRSFFAEAEFREFHIDVVGYDEKVARGVELVESGERRHGIAREVHVRERLQNEHPISRDRPLRQKPLELRRVFEIGKGVRLGEGFDG